MTTLNLTALLESGWTLALKHYPQGFYRFPGKLFNAEMRFNHRGGCRFSPEVDVWSTTPGEAIRLAVNEANRVVLEWATEDAAEEAAMDDDPPLDLNESNQPAVTDEF